MSRTVPPTRYTPPGARAEPGDRVCDPPQARARPELLGDALGRLELARGSALERPQQVRAAHDADELVVAHDRNAPVLGGRDERAQLAERRVLSGGRDAAAHDASHGRVREVVADRLVEVLPAHAADEPTVLDDEDAALAMSLTDPHGVTHRRGRARRRAQGST